MVNWFEKQLAMDVEVDHYVILGLPSGEEGAKLSEEEITKAHRSMLKKLHPDKRPDDPHAHANFLNLQASFNILMDKKARHIFHQQQIKPKPRRKSQEENSNSKRRHRKSTDVDERERVKRAAHAAAKAARDMEECIRRKDEQLIARLIREAAASKAPPAAAASTLDKGAAAEEAASTQRHCRGDWLDEQEFSSNFGGGGFEEHENSLLTKFRKKDKLYPEASTSLKEECHSGSS